MMANCIWVVVHICMQLGMWVANFPSFLAEPRWPVITTENLTLL
jgi:hypothetical protein